MHIVHIKILPKYYEAIASGADTFEIMDSTKVSIGDMVIFHEWDGCEYTGRVAIRDVIYLLGSGETIGF